MADEDDWATAVTQQESVSKKVSYFDRKLRDFKLAPDEHLLPVNHVLGEYSMLF